MVEADDGHGYTLPRRLAAYRWMNRWLKGVDSSISEPKMQLESEETLYCTSSGQVQTSLGGETVFSLNLKRSAQMPPKRKLPSDAQDVAKFQRELSQQIRRLTGLQDAQHPLNTRSFGELRREGYRIEKLVYESEPGILIPALLFVPNSTEARKPAVLFVQGRDKAADAGAGGDIEKLVKSGHVVLTIDVRGSGETQVRQNPDTASDFYRYFGDFESAMTAMLLGKTLVGLRARDIRCGVDLLNARTDVDPNRIRAVGKGQGAIVLVHAAVGDDRIKGLVLQNMLISYQSVVTHRVHRRLCESVVPDVLEYYDLPDLVGALAPRPVWIINSVDPLDHLVSGKEQSAAYAGSLEAYRVMGAVQALQLKQTNPGEPFENLYGPFAVVGNGDRN